MRFVYKINSRYDGFTPRKIPDRLLGGLLGLGWARYIDVVEAGDEVWVYFLGPHRFDDGVYVQGVAETVDYDKSVVYVRPTEYSTSVPMGTLAESSAVAGIVATRYRQVFYLPETIGAVENCTLLGVANTCRRRLCSHCSTWRALPGVSRTILRTPPRLDGFVERFAPAYWVIPRRSFLYREGSPKPGVQRTSDLFYRFKAGDANMAYPLALGMHRALARARRTDFDAVVPVPLSPEKAERGELHRTGALAGELGKILGVPVRPWLSLERVVSKRALRTNLGYSAAEFEAAYARNLAIDTEAATAARILLVDDVCTEGSTLRVCARALGQPSRGCSVVASTAGQMVVRPAVVDSSPLLR